jgi:two-component system sensor histidine kinase HydH
MYILPKASNLEIEPDLTAFRRRETSVALVNLAVLASLFLLHVLFVSHLGPPRPLLVWVLTALFLANLSSLFWVQGLRELPSPRAILTHASLTIWFMVLGAVLASLFGEGEEHHYFVLMVPAIVSAGFRFSLAATLAVVCVGGGLLYADVLLWFAKHPPIVVMELFEAGVLWIVFFVLGVVVWLLAESGRRARQQLRMGLHELEQARDRLVAEERLSAVGRLASSIAHEIRNPVGMISSSLAAAHREGLSEEQRRTMFDVATEEASRLERLTTDFLAYAHTRPPERRPTSIHDAVGYVAELARARAAERRLSLETSVEARLCAFVDAHQVHQALLNLVTNAIAHSAPGGTVRLGAAARAGERIVLWVENAGEAIPAEAVARLYEPFFTTRQGGTGLGLPIAGNIARAHDGELRLAVNEPGRVCFEIELPRCTECVRRGEKDLCPIS